MQKLLIATTNPAKLNELSCLLSDLPLELVSLHDVGITTEVEEDGKNYIENSQKKAREYARLSGLPAVADDGGLEIVALGGAPGLKSHRWLGPHTTEDQLIAHMTKLAKELPDANRQAFFKTVVSFALPIGNVQSISGEIEGIIAHEPSLNLIKGFPYRSFFFLPQINKYYFETELTPEEMKEYNHRVKAVNKLKSLLKETFHF
ncbi:MAG: non-canonical purine NTP pyrophosphatase [Candidatus Levyibacteriota bacterium]